MYTTMYKTVYIIYILVYRFVCDGDCEKIPYAVKLTVVINRAVIMTDEKIFTTFFYSL